MLKRIRIEGYKSLHNTEVNVAPLTVLLGANLAGKSNFLDSLQLLSRLATCDSVSEAFESPHRSPPLESFTYQESGIEGLLGQERLSMRLEADLWLADPVVEAANRLMRDSWTVRSAEFAPADIASPPQVRERCLRYRIGLEMRPKAGTVRVTDEYLGVLVQNGHSLEYGSALIERNADDVRLRHARSPAFTELPCAPDASVLSLRHQAPYHPQLAAVQIELRRWKFFNFDPHDRMRSANPLSDVKDIGRRGENLPAFLHSLKARRPRAFESVERALHLLVPAIKKIDIRVNRTGQIELGVWEGSALVPSRSLSAGTLRMLGLLALTVLDEAPSLVGCEEPEHGVHSRRLPFLCEIFKTQEILGETQYLITSHSPKLPDYVDPRSLFVVSRKNGLNRIDPISAYDSGRNASSHPATPDHLEMPSVSERILAGDLDP